MSLGDASQVALAGSADVQVDSQRDRQLGSEDLVACGQLSEIVCVLPAEGELLLLEAVDALPASSVSWPRFFVESDFEPPLPLKSGGG